MAVATAWPDLGAPAPANDPFADLRAAYHARLRMDNERLLDFRSTLSGARLDARGDYAALGLAAHQMAGAAAVFKASAICSAAGHLEHLASGASSTATTANGHVLGALDVLIAAIAAIAAVHTAL